MTSMFDKNNEKSNEDRVNKADYPGSFMTCVLKVNGTGWEKIVTKVLGNMCGVYNFKLVGNGKIIVSGKVDPQKLLKVMAKAGKKAELLWWQFGECTQNLILPIDQHYLTMNNSYHSYESSGGYCGGFYNGYGGNNYYQGSVSRSIRPDDLLCPCPTSSLHQNSEKEEPIQCCTIM